MNRIKKILLVDDDSDERFIFSEALKEMSTKVDCTYAGSGEEALKILRNSDHSAPDIIFLDLNMPRLNGHDCLFEIKKDEQISDIPVVIFTTSDRQEDIDKVKSRGAAYFLTKPSFNNLITIIKFLIEEPDKEHVEPEMMHRISRILKKLN